MERCCLIEFLPAQSISGSDLSDKQFEADDDSLVYFVPQQILKYSFCQRLEQIN